MKVGFRFCRYCCFGRFLSPTSLLQLRQIAWLTSHNALQAPPPLSSSTLIALLRQLATRQHRQTGQGECWEGYDGSVLKPGECSGSRERRSDVEASTGEQEEGGKGYGNAFASARLLSTGTSGHSTAGQCPRNTLAARPSTRLFFPSFSFDCPPNLPLKSASSSPALSSRPTKSMVVPEQGRRCRQGAFSSRLAFPVAVRSFSSSSPSFLLPPVPSYGADSRPRTGRPAPA